MSVGFWKIWIDTGGTFTDCLARDPAGRLHRAKVLSSAALRGVVLEQLDQQHVLVQTNWAVPDHFIDGFTFRLLAPPQIRATISGYSAEKQTIALASPLSPGATPGAAFEVQSAEPAAILAARLVTRTPARHPLPPLHMRLATTKGTNALLERTGEKVVLFITAGFEDLLLIGTQQRPNLFTLEIKKPEQLYAHVCPVAERLGAEGRVLQALDGRALQEEAAALVRAGFKSAAVAFLHSYRNPAHEQEAADILRETGFEYVACSAELAPFIKILPRAQTTIVDAYLGPVMQRYLAQITAALSEGHLHVMTSAGGLVQHRDFHAKDSLLSGPAGGVAGAAAAGKRSGFDRIISFDMGGTSTDVARYDGDFEYVFEHTVANALLAAPALAIETVAAGGGSICWHDGARLRVGPQSAGADPGPACYGAGGPLTLTDVNLLLGRLQPDCFEIPICRENADERLQELLDRPAKGNLPQNREAVLGGFLHIANERMADAIRRISLRRGYDPREYTLVAFGGAGAQHACAIAALLGMKTIAVPQDASLLSAAGLGQAVIERFVERQVLAPLERVSVRLQEVLQEMQETAIDAVCAEGVPRHQVEVRRILCNLRYAGQETALAIPYQQKKPLRAAFEERYAALYGYLPEDRPLEVESLRVIASSRKQQVTPAGKPAAIFTAMTDADTLAYFNGEWTAVPCFERKNLVPGANLTGPALIVEAHSVIVVEPGWQASVDAAGTLILRHA